jgi:RHS repeat-associated protein
MADWYYRLDRDLEKGVRFDDQMYQPNQEFKSQNACEMQRFRAAFRAQTGRDFREDVPGAIAELDRACPPGQAGAPDTGNEHDQPTAAPVTPSQDGAPGRDGDSPGTLGAPDVDTGGTIGREPSGAGDTDDRPPAEQLYDRDAPAPEQDVADRLADEGLPPQEVDERLEEGRRGDPPPGQPHPFRSGEQPPDPTAASDPVDLFTGEFTIETVDLELPGAGFDFRLVRTYASGRPAYGPFGFNWDHSYNVALRELDDGAVAIWTGRLREDVYRPDPAGGFMPPATGVHTSLTVDRDAVGAVVSYTLRFRGGFAWDFRRPLGWPDGLRYPLVRVRDRHGNEHVCYYDGQGRLDRVVDTVGRVVTFHYGTCGLLEAVSDPTGRVIRYDHAPDAERLARVVGPTVEAGPPTVNYVYADADHPLLRNNIVAVIDGAGQVVVENRYGTDPAADDFNRVVAQLESSSEYRFAYERLRYVDLAPESMNDAAARTEMLEPDGTYRVYTFNVRGLLLDERTRLRADGSYRVWATSYRYTNAGALAEIRRPNGLTTRMTYDEDNADPCARGNMLELRLVAPPTAPAAPRRIWSATYEPRYQQVKAVTDETGATTTFHYDYEDAPGPATSGRLTRMVLPDTTLPDGTVQAAAEHYVFDERGRLRERRSAEQHRFTYEYHAAGDGIGQLSRSVAGAGLDDETWTYGYDAAGRRTGVTDAFGASWSTAYDALDRVVARAAPPVGGMPSVTRFRYGPSGRPSGQRRPRGNYVDAIITGEELHDEVAYDVARHERTTTEAANTETPCTIVERLDHMGRTIEVRDGAGRRTTTRFDERGLPIEHTLGFGVGTLRRVRLAYDRNGNLRRLQRPGQPTSLFAYDAWDRLVRVQTDAVRTRVDIAYGIGDRAASITVNGPPGPGRTPVTLSSLELRYDERGRLRERRQAATEQQLWYDRDDRLARVTDQHGRSIEVLRDAMGRGRRITDPLGNRVTSTVDAAGRVTALLEEEVDPAGGMQAFRTAFGFDAAHRLTSIDDGDGHVVATAYDARHLAVAVTAPGGGESELGYDAFGELVRVASGGPGQQMVVSWTRDGAARVTSHTDPLGRRTQYRYGLDDRWAAIIRPDGMRHERVFDDAGRIAQERSPSGSAVGLGYGPDGNVRRMTYSSPPGIQVPPDLVCRYDGLGRPVRYQQGQETLDWRWDALDRLVEERSSAGSTNWAYDDANGTADLTYPDGRVERIELDALDRPIRIVHRQDGAAGLVALAAGSTIARYTYTGPERVARRELANDTETQLGYDAGRRLAAIEHLDAAGTTLAAIRHVHDRDSRRRLVLAVPAPGANRWHDFDAASRLVGVEEGFAAAAPPVGATQAEQDQALAALGRPAGVDSATFAYTNADELRRAVTVRAGAAQRDDYAIDDLSRFVSRTRTAGGAPTVTPFAFDADGRRELDARHRYVYDAAGRLVSVRDTGGALLLELGYDPVGRLVERRAPGAPARRIHWAGARAVQEDAGGVAARQLTTGLYPDELIVSSDGADTFAHLDARQSLLATTSGAGAVTERYAYAPFGEASIFAPDGVTERAASAVGVDPRFGGYPVLLPALFDARARAYDADTGAFLQRDPRGFGGSPNPYAFAGQDPIDHVDPTGEIVPLVIAVGVIIGALAGAGYSGYDAYHHPERYSGDFSWRTLFQVFGGAGIGGLSAVGGVAAGGVTTSLVGGGTAAAGTAGAAGTTGAAVGVTALLKGFVISGASAAAGGAVWSAGFHRMFPEIVDRPTLRGAAVDFAFGGALSFAKPVLKAIVPASLWRSATTGVDEVATATGLAREGPWRTFGETWEMLRNRRVQYNLLDLAYDNRTRAAVLSQYRGRPGWAVGIGNSIQHLWAMESSAWVPRGLRQAGLNLIEVPGALNSWMTNIPARNIGFRAAVASILTATGLGAYEVTSLTLGEETPHYILGDPPPSAPPERDPGSATADPGTGKG